MYDLVLDKPEGFIGQETQPNQTNLSIISNIYEGYYYI